MSETRKLNLRDCFRVKAVEGLQLCNAACTVGIMSSGGYHVWGSGLYSFDHMKKEEIGSLHNNSIFPWMHIKCYSLCKIIYSLPQCCEGRGYNHQCIK